jgi:DNA-binding PadR family transcriptional regulator
VRRKSGALVPLELAICAAAVALQSRGTARFHGYLLAKQLNGAPGMRLLTAYGTLYRALARLEQMGLVASEWEDPQIPANENRPRRRLYVITEHGHKAVTDADAARRLQHAPAVSRRPSPAGARPLRPA